MPRSALDGTILDRVVGRSRGIAFTFALAAAFAAGACQAEAFWTIGSNLDSPAGIGQDCLPSCTIANKTIATEDVAADGATAPVSGIVTEWALRTIDVYGPPSRLRLRVLTAPPAPPRSSFFPPAASPGTVATGASEPVTVQSLNGIQRFPAHVPIEAGQRVGVDFMGGDGRSHYPPFLTGASASSEVDSWNPALPEGGSGDGVYGRQEHLLLQARVEPDADGDGYGDETQDVVTPQDVVDCQVEPSCAPTTTIEGISRRGSARRARIRFASNDPGSRFKCSLDRHAFRRCTSPTRLRKLRHGRKLRPGRHRFAVRAIASGMTDQTPAVATIRVGRRR